MKEVIKPWGKEEIFGHVEGKYVGKILYIKKGHSLSLQHHEVKDETIRILKGQMGLRIGDSPEEALKMNPIIMNIGESFHIPPKKVHRMIALEDVEVLEVSTSELDDVVRHQDIYGRT